MNEQIIIKGARENNLKNINITLPRNKLIVLTGLSGSGKSTLAFDTIYAEGQRRYVESLSSYARQFMGGMEKPDVDSIEGLSPAIAIDQKTTSNNPRSTVGTVTEIYDYFRLLYARIGIPYCPNHNIPIMSQTISQMIEKIYELEEGTAIYIISPYARGKKGTFKDLFEKLLKNGFIRVRINNEIKLIEEIEELDKNKKYDIDIVIDRLKISKDKQSRIYDSLETALKWGNGMVLVVPNGKEEILFSENYSCPHCGFSVGTLEPRLFSFNAPLGACPDCAGIGAKKVVDTELLVPNKDLSLNEAAIVYYKNIAGSENLEWKEFVFLCDYYKIDMNKPYKELNEFEQDIVLNGSREPIRFSLESRSGNTVNRSRFIEGAKTHIERMYLETVSEFMRTYYSSFMRELECPTCKGKRLSERALSVKVNGLSIHEMTDMPISKILETVKNLSLTPSQEEISRLIRKEIIERLTFLNDVGLNYLTLSRSAGTLSGGESQRIRLATQIGSRLTGVLYVLDEPSIGLHQRDNEKLIQTLCDMRDLGNSVLVVEHDEDTMRASDYIIDIGPGAGVHGGQIVAAGTPEEVMNNENSITGKYLSGKLTIPVPKKRRKGNGLFLEVKGASENNLKNINVKFPLGKFVCVTGVSGSGKSTLVNEILCKAVRAQVYKSKEKPGAHKEIKGLEHVDKVIEVSQDPIGRTPRSNPVTYTGVFDEIRDLFTKTPEAKMRGYDKGRFSFNVKGGRCEACQGDGVKRISMHFLPDVFVACEECEGKRYNEETLQVTYKDKNIYDVLEMTIEDSLTFFENLPKIHNRLKTIEDVGLGYVKLGQSATTLSGGEAQRVKLASELQKKATGKTVYILDEPTTGLHSHDVARLIEVLNRIVDAGDTVIVIEHNLDVIKVADHIIDLGLEGGDNGGTIVVEGTPEKVAQNQVSHTGRFLRKVLP